MIRINLLPHRELKRQARQRQIAILAGLTAALGIAVVAVVHVGIVTQIENQNGRNKYLQGQIAILDKQIEEIKKLKEQTQALLSRKKVVEALQSNRSDIVHVLDQLARLLPDGVYLKSLKQTGNRLTISGYAQSNARVSTLMRNLESSPWMSSPTLVQISAVTVANQRLSEFNLFLSIGQKAPPPSDKKAAAAAPGGAPAQDAKKPGAATEKPKG